MNSNEKPTRQKVADEFGFLEGLVSERTYGMIVDNVMDILPPLVEGEWVMVKDTGWTEAAKPAAPAPSEPAPDHIPGVGEMVAARQPRQKEID